MTDEEICRLAKAIENERATALQVAEEKVKEAHGAFAAAWRRLERAQAHRARSMEAMGFEPKPVGTLPPWLKAALLTAIERPSAEVDEW